jgi:predicted ATPase
MIPIASQSQPAALSRIAIHGFKSIQECDVALGNLNVLIGANGSGKSNFLEFFQLVGQMMEGKLQRHVGRAGGPDALLHFGRKKTEELSAQLHFEESAYAFALEPTRDNRMMFSREEFQSPGNADNTVGAGHFESRANQEADGNPARNIIVPAIRNWRAYHFHDTGETARLKQPHSIQFNDFLRPDARNLAAFLHRLHRNHPAAYRRIVQTIRLAAPFFDDFSLRPHPDNPEKIELEWIEAGEDAPLKAHRLSDGTLRFICLTAALMQPDEFLPGTLLIDEPELGLHPTAIHLLAGMIRSVSTHRQLIVSTQSTDLLDEFEPERVIVVDRIDGQSRFHRLEPGALTEWLAEYSLAELWRKNVLGGRPAR